MTSDLAVWTQTIQLFLCALSLGFAYFVARYGVEHFNKVFAAVMLSTGISGALIFSSLGSVGGSLFSTESNALIYWGVVLLVAFGFLVFGRILSHVAVFLLITLLVVVAGRAVGIDANPTLNISAAAAAVVFTFLLRRHTIKVLVGAASGLYATQITYTLLSYIVGNSVNVYDPQSYVNATIALIVILVATPVILMGLGIALQYLWHAKVFGPKAVAGS